MMQAQAIIAQGRRVLCRSRALDSGGCSGGLSRDDRRHCQILPRPGSDDPAQFPQVGSASFLQSGINIISLETPSNAQLPVLLLIHEGRTEKSTQVGKRAREHGWQFHGTVAPVPAQHVWSLEAPSQGLFSHVLFSSTGAAAPLAVLTHYTPTCLFLAGRHEVLPHIATLVDRDVRNWNQH
ncbi:hypothetical protein J6590_098402 [Homalodisca vitripennis]|nr:hypothetical protein J6590_098402 [Homalodisca vitripennis]